MQRRPDGQIVYLQPLFVEAVEGRRLKLGDTHPRTIESFNNLIELYEAWNKPEEADKWRSKLGHRDDAEKQSKDGAHGTGLVGLLCQGCDLLRSYCSAVEPVPSALFSAGSERSRMDPNVVDQAPSTRSGVVPGLRAQASRAHARDLGYGLTARL